MTGSLALEEIALSIDGRRLFQPVDAVVEPGEIVTLVGPSGCGKSSLLSFICGTLDPVFTPEGRALLAGEDLAPLPPERRQIGILFQDDLLFPHLSVGQNLAFGLPRGLDRAERERRIQSALADAGLEGFAERDPATLSGGQRARVAVLRVLLSGPRALLLDEPFGKLDVALRDRFRQFVFDHVRGDHVRGDHAGEAGLPTLMVTHDPEDAAAAGGRKIDLE